MKKLIIQSNYQLSGVIFFPVFTFCDLITCKTFKTYFEIIYYLLFILSIDKAFHSFISHLFYLGSMSHYLFASLKLFLVTTLIFLMFHIANSCKKKKRLNTGTDNLIEGKIMCSFFGGKKPKPNKVKLIGTMIA